MMTICVNDWISLSSGRIMLTNISRSSGIFDGSGSFGLYGSPYWPYALNSVQSPKWWSPIIARDFVPGGVHGGLSTRKLKRVIRLGFESDLRYCKDQAYKNPRKVNRIWRGKNLRLSNFSYLLKSNFIFDFEIIKRSHWALHLDKTSARFPASTLTSLSLRLQFLPGCH